MKFKPANISKINGTWLQGNITATYDELIAVFGKPRIADGYKTQAEWDLEFEDGTIATIYDWKESKEYNGDNAGIGPEDVTNWMIGGRSEDAAKLVHECFNQPLSSNKEDSCDDYFCIGTDGRLWILGNHGDYEAAEDTAKSLGVEVVWMFGKDTAMDWRDSLLQALPLKAVNSVEWD